MDSLSGAGTQTAALSIGGGTPRLKSWNGTNWSNDSQMNTARGSLASDGTQTAAIAMGGAPPVTGATELWIGTGLYIETLTTTEDD